jgi:NAD(P)-dependent dehydrogenase (short-subunit alcohol dehydrogenase family)
LERDLERVVLRSATASNTSTRAGSALPRSGYACHVDVAVVTGAGRGIGREIARGLANRGYAVLCTDVAAEGAAETAVELGDSAWSMPQDVRDPNSHRAVAAAAAERGPLRVWVNNAGILRTQRTWAHPDEEVRALVDVNLLGVLYGSRAAIEAMRTGAGGHIINMASMSSFGFAPGLAIYGATKHAVHAFSGSLQGDLAEEGVPIRVHAVCPDGVDTGMVRERQDESESAIIFSAPRLLTPEEVARHAVALIDGNQIVKAIPRWRAWTVRLSVPFPRLHLRLLAMFKRMGEHRRRREAAA